MIAEYNVNLENKTKSELILFIKELQDMLKEKDKEIEYQKEKRENQKTELAILNKKQKEMNKLINTVQSYKGMFKKSQKEIKNKDKIINLMAEQLAGLTTWDNEKEEPLILTDKEEVKQYFERKSEE